MSDAPCKHQWEKGHTDLVMCRLCDAYACPVCGTVNPAPAYAGLAVYCEQCGHDCTEKAGADGCQTCKILGITQV